MSKPPYEDLFIYEIAGDAREACQGAGPGFLGLWLEADTSFVFFDRPSDQTVELILAKDADLRLLNQHNLTYEQWQGGQSLEPVLAGDLHIAPAWSNYHAPPGAVHLRLDPGLVFGSGLHPTTQHCLELLDLRRQKSSLGHVLDLGCGTGILAMAAAAWGASAVDAVDLNPLCVSTTADNAKLNGLNISAHEGQAQDFIHLPAGVVLSNLHWQVQEKILADPAKLEGKTDLILSGIMRSFVGPLKARLDQLGYKIFEQREADFTWFTLWAVR